MNGRGSGEHTHFGLARTSFWNGLAVVIRLAVSLILNKVLAVLIGPAGYAAIGQFQNAVQIVFTIATGSINNGVTKYTAEYAAEPDQQGVLWSTAFRLMLITAVPSALAIVIFSRPLSEYFLHDQRYTGVFVWLAVSIILFSLNTLLLAIVNGLQDLHTYVVSNIAGSVFVLLVMTALTWAFGLYGALVAIAINQSLIFFVTIAQVIRKPWFQNGWLHKKFSRQIAARLYSFAIMAAVSAIANAGGQVIVRRIIQGEYNAEYAGYWDAMIKISQINMLLVATTMSFYFIPRMSQLETGPEIRREVWTGSRLILPLFAVGAIVTYVLRDTVVSLLFSESFSPMESLFAWQLAGDTIRVASWFAAYVMIGKALVKSYVATEILTNGLFVVLSGFFIEAVGFEGVALAHFVTYAIALLGMYLTLTVIFHLKDKRSS
jgi:PST family polysaccharide transporter